MLDLYCDYQTTIHGLTYQQLDSAKLVDFWDAEVIHIRSYAFTGLTDVEFLLFPGFYSVYSIRTVESYAFYGMESLTQLDLGFQLFTTLEPDTFAGAPGIALLYLDNGCINTIRSHAFRGLQKSHLFRN